MSGSRLPGSGNPDWGWKPNDARSRSSRPPGGAEELARFREMESGRRADRPELAKALHHAKVTGATLVIAKLDRLGRNAAFLLALRDSGIKFVAVNMPAAHAS